MLQTRSTARRDVTLPELDDDDDDNHGIPVIASQFQFLFQNGNSYTNILSTNETSDTEDNDPHQSPNIMEYSDTEEDTDESFNEMEGDDTVGLHTHRDGLSTQPDDHPVTFLLHVTEHLLKRIVIIAYRKQRRRELLKGRHHFFLLGSMRKKRKGDNELHVAEVRRRREGSVLSTWQQQRSPWIA